MKRQAFASFDCIMRAPLILMFCWLVAAARGDDQATARRDDTFKDVRDTYVEKGGDPKGMRIESEDSVVDHEKGDDSPIRLYYIVDQHGKKRSGYVIGGILPLMHDNITFQWLDQQKFLVVINNRHKMFSVHAYARNSKDWYEEIKSDINDDKIREKTIRFILAKRNPELSAEKLEELERPDNETVDVDALNASATGMDVPVLQETRGGDIVIRYRFDCKTRQLVRKSVIMPVDDNEKNDFRVSSEELNKALAEFLPHEGGQKKRLK